MQRIPQQTIQPIDTIMINQATNLNSMPKLSFFALNNKNMPADNEISNKAIAIVGEQFMVIGFND